MIPVAQRDQLQAEAAAAGCTCGEALAISLLTAGFVYFQHRRECPILVRQRRIQQAGYN